MKVLFDSGCGATLVNHSLIGKLQTTQGKKTKWKTKSGSFFTDKKCKIKFSLPSFHEHRKISWNCYVDETDPEFCNYDLIIGRDLMHELGIDISFSNAEVVWDNASIPMQETDKLEQRFIDHFEQELLFAHDPVTTDAERIQNIVENKYCPADLLSIANECKLLNAKEQQQLYNLLNKFAHLFDGTLGSWNTDPVDLELRDEDGKPYHA